MTLKSKSTTVKNSKTLEHFKISSVFRLYRGSTDRIGLTKAQSLAPLNRLILAILHRFYLTSLLTLTSIRITTQNQYNFSGFRHVKRRTERGRWRVEKSHRGETFAATDAEKAAGRRWTAVSKEYRPLQASTHCDFTGRRSHKVRALLLAYSPAHFASTWRLKSVSTRGQSRTESSLAYRRRGIFLVNFTRQRSRRRL